MRVRTKRKGRAHVVVPAELVQNPDLSAEARFVYVLLMSYPDDWEFRHEHLQNVTGFGRDKVTRVIGELRAIGLVETIHTRGEGGRVTGSTWYVYDTTEAQRRKEDAAETSRAAPCDRGPENQSPGDRHRGPENPGPGQPDSGNPGHLTNKKDQPEESESPPTPRASAEPASPDVSVTLRSLRAIWPVDRARAPKRAEKALREAVAAGVAQSAILAEARTYIEAEKDRERFRFVKPLHAWIDALPGAHVPSPPVSAEAADGVLRMFAERINQGAFVSPSALTSAKARRIVELGLVPEAVMHQQGFL